MTLSGDIGAQKALLRAAQLQKRASIPPEERAAWDTALVREIAQSNAFLCADTLLLYAPVRGEPDLLALFDAASAKGMRCAFPRCEGKEMRFHHVARLCELEPGRFGIPTPPSHAPLVTPTHRTLCILPALAATKSGARLGYGGGFYDRYLARFRVHTLLGIYQILMLDTLPLEPTDRMADTVITEKGVILDG